MRLLMLFLATLAAVAVANAAPTTLLEDAEGDETLILTDPVPGSDDPSGRWPEADLRSLSIEEDAMSLTLTLGLTGLEGAGTDPESYPQYTLSFKDGKRAYSVVVYVFSGDMWAYLVEGSPEDGRYVAEVEIARDDDAGTLTFTVPREHLVDEDGSPLLKGHVLSFPGVEAVGMTLFGFGEDGLVRVRDRMPDALDGTAKYIVQTGGEATGSLLMTSPRPYRLSNGEATTYAFDVLLQAREGGSGIHTLEAFDVPDGWQVTLPNDAVDVSPGFTTFATVLVAVPFQHVHGALETVGIRANGPAGTAQLELGVRYTTIAQPSGHHPTLYVHSSGPPQPMEFAPSSMNTALDDPEDTGDEIGGLETCFGNGSNSVIWFTRLSPPLGMGLDFDLNRTGTLTFTLLPEKPFVNAEAFGYLYGGYELAIVETKALGNLEANKPIYVTLTITPTEDADYLPWDGSSIGMMFGIHYVGTNVLGTTCIGGPALVNIAPGASIFLPLEDFHEALGEPTTGPWSVDQKVRTVAPGSTILIEATFDARDDADYTFSLAGANVAWGRITTPATQRIENGSIATVQVAVVVPSDATDLDRADLVLSARADGMPADLARFVVAVDPQAARVEDPLPTTVAPEKASPGAGLALLACVLMGALVMRRAKQS